jgi:molybdopterin-guanine dinucleotide biosynthesis protein A
LGGSLKGLEFVGRTRIVDRVVSAIKTVTPDVVLSANHADASMWLEHVAVVSDKSPGMGGIAGIHAALGSGRDVIVVAWDMPFITGELLQAIVSHGVEHGADAAVPQSDSPFGVEPFCAWYSARALEPMGRFLAEGGGSARDLLARLARVQYIPQSLTARFGDPRLRFFSVNTADDLARARAIEDEAQ